MRSEPPRSARRCSACSRKSAPSACSRTATRGQERRAPSSPASTRTRSSTTWISARSRSASGRIHCRKKSPRSGSGTACRSCASNDSWSRSVPVLAGWDRKRHHRNAFFQEFARLFATRLAADVSVGDLLVMHAPRLGGDLLSHVLGIEQDGVDEFVQVARPSGRRDGRLRVLPRRLGLRPADLRREQFLDAGIAANRAREQAAGFLALEVIRRSKPALEPMTIRADKAKYDHVRVLGGDSTALRLYGAPIPCFKG